MINFNGGSVALGSTISPLGAYVGYLLLNSGNVWLAFCFLVLTALYFFIVAAMICRYIINYRRNQRPSVREKVLA